jgi:ABC-type branched-subunit amino acid transport system ATPase component
LFGHHPIDAGAVRFEGRDIVGLRVQAIARLGVSGNSENIVNKLQIKS